MVYLLDSNQERYHWALMVGPKSETVQSQASRFHAKEYISFVGNPPTQRAVWEYEERDTTVLPTSMQLVRVLIGKVKDMNRLKSIFRNIPVRPEVQGWNCVGWVKEGVETALQDKNTLGVPKTLSWDLIRDAAMWYVAQKKAAHRFDGQGDYDQDKAAPWDMLEGIERVP